MERGVAASYVRRSQLPVSVRQPTTFEPMEDSSTIKILMQEDENVETLWGERVGTNSYRVDNSPFWAYGVSWKDVIEAHPDPDGMLRMTRVVEKSGHRTVRIMFELSNEELKRPATPRSLVG